MIQIKRFIERVSAQEGRAGRDVVIPIADARLLRDEIAFLMADRVIELERNPPVTEVVVQGGKWSK
jgi:hypothetical protein